MLCSYRNSTGEHWMKNLDIPYYFTGIEPFYPPISPFYGFIKAHLVLLSKDDQIFKGSEYDKCLLLQKALDEEFPIYYDLVALDEDFHMSNFVFPSILC